MTTHDKRVVHSSKESNWRTPPELFRALDREFHFELDAAADETNHLCSRWHGPGSPFGSDGLDVPWEHLVTFLNPPYSRELGLLIDPWVQKCFTEAQQGCTIVAVLPHAVQTGWYREFVYGHGVVRATRVTLKMLAWSGFAAVEVRQIPHRVSFLWPDGTERCNAPGNTCVVIWQPNPGYVGPWVPMVRYWTYR